MPMSQVCMDGIKANGLAWRHHLSLGGQHKRMGEMTDATCDDDVENCVTAIVATTRRFAASLLSSAQRGAEPYTGETIKDYQAGNGLMEKVEQLEESADCGLDEAKYAMHILYDEFDYHRICVVS